MSHLALEGKVSHQWQSALPRTVPQGPAGEGFPRGACSNDDSQSFSRRKHRTHRGCRSPIQPTA